MLFPYRWKLFLFQLSDTHDNDIDQITTKNNDSGKDHNDEKEDCDVLRDRYRDDLYHKSPPLKFRLVSMDTFMIAQSCGKVHGKMRAFQVPILLLYWSYI